jgi:hypothetical protein
MNRKTNKLTGNINQFAVEIGTGLFKLVSIGGAYIFRVVFGQQLEL